MNVQQLGMILLIKSALTGEKYSLPKGFDFELASKTAYRHQISAMLYYGALNCDIPQDSPVMQKLFTDTCRVIFISEQQTYAINEIFAQFDAGEIYYMPLKGTLLKKLYPKPEMRIMSDVDILIRTEQYDKIKPIMEKLGYTAQIESDHELIWYKNGIHIELHKRLIPSYNKDYYEYFGDGWRLGVPLADNSTRCAMCAEDEIIYLFTHYAKHYRDSGIGIKHIVDLWVYRNSIKKLNDEYIFAELKKLQLLDFYKNTMRTLDVWFGEEKSDEITDFITGIIFNSGVYGTHETYILSATLKDSKKVGTVQRARMKKLWYFIFLPYRHMCIKYKILEKYPLLLPFLWVVRWLDALIFKRSNIKKNSDNLKIMSIQNVDDYQKALNFVGLDFNFTK